MATPFLKWAGGKRQIMSELLTRFPIDIDDYQYYVEPFLGGGSVMIEVLNNGFEGKIIAGDINTDIISCYSVIKDSVEELLVELAKLTEDLPEELDSRKPYYYSLRKEWNSGVNVLEENCNNQKVRRAALTIILNKTCYNGLFRLNSKGEFNVPMGGTKKLSVYHENNLRKLNSLFQNVKFFVGDFSEISKHIPVGKKSFFYFDPPYRRLKKTSSLTMYNADPFGDDQQIRLRDFIDNLVNNECQFLLSNSDPKNYSDDDFFDAAYRNYTIDRIPARRSINSKATGRGEINELLIRSNHTIRGDVN
jgi:DNA adenine methylase